MSRRRDACCVLMIALMGCGARQSSDATGRKADAAEVPLPPRVLPRPKATHPVPPPDYGVIGERDLFQPKLLTRRPKQNSEKTNRWLPVAPPVVPLSPVQPLPTSSGTEPTSRESESHPLTGWRVAGVIIADGRQAAWLEDANRQVMWVEVGTRIADGQKVIAITSSGVTVQGQDGQEVVLQGRKGLEQDALSPTAASARTGQPLEKRIQGQPAVREP